MSGKAPPRGPRALLNSLPPAAPSAPGAGAGQSASQQSNSAGQQGHTPASGPRSASTSSPATRIGAAPPTGPRSLTTQTILPALGGRKKQLTNGHSHPIASGSNIGLNTTNGPVSLKTKIHMKVRMDNPAIVHVSQLYALSWSLAHISFLII